MLNNIPFVKLGLITVTSAFNVTPEALFTVKLSTVNPTALIVIDQLNNIVLF